MLDQEALDSATGHFFDAIQARSRLLLNWYRSRGVLHRTIFAPAVVQSPPRPADPDMRVTPIGLTLDVAGEHAPSTVHLMSLVATATEALITVVMRMHWPADGSSPDLEITGAGPHHLPYDRFWAVDDEGTRYTARFEAGYGETAAWRGVIQLSPVPPRRARWLDLTGDGTPLVRLSLRPAAAPGRPPAPPSAEPAAISPADHLLTLEAERILATGDAAGPAEGPSPGEIITVLTDVGAIAAGNPLPGQLAALCQRLGAARHGITVRPAADIPAEWASVVAHRDAPVPAGAPELFAPLAAVLPDAGGAWIAVAGLSSAAGQSHLHLVTIGLPPVADRFAYNWTPGYSWWLTDGGGNWHVGTAGEPWTFGDGTQAFRLRLTPALTAIPDAAELVLTGPSTRVRVRFPVIGPGLRSARSRVTVEASMRPLIVEVPSPLGLRPSGVELAPAALRAAGLHARLGCDDAQHVAVPPYDDRRDRPPASSTPGASPRWPAPWPVSSSPRCRPAGCPWCWAATAALSWARCWPCGGGAATAWSSWTGTPTSSIPATSRTGRSPRWISPSPPAAAPGRSPTWTGSHRWCVPRTSRWSATGSSTTTTGSAHEHVRDSGITVLDYRDLRAGTIPLILDRALATVTRPWLQGFWVHLDVDVLDDAIMPAVDYRHPGGLSWDEAAQLLQGLLGRPGARGLDVTIFNPNLDPDGSIARQLCELIARCVPAAG